ncbi:unnamed protein product [Bursaphelenchus xylophilus]|uniref:(pine wood nematode) hypothetical protein n=1 Tax=Bursaphelenchus xylophilus TaxID=6326 RepID=A0A1I7S0G2_BURXY|nr:unnamed protein product [Bursaphelenchus xylophilus]CAG9132243.1 unnamed protein product [Bursaphelenchus xylophilus]
MLTLIQISKLAIGKIVKEVEPRFHSRFLRGRSMSVIDVCLIFIMEMQSQTLCLIAVVVLAVGLTTDAALRNRNRRGRNNSTDTTTTVAADSTTDAPLTTTTSSNSSDSCEAQKVCYADSDCGGKGRCLGIFVAKCNCNACINFLTCEDDSACGGLKGACNGTTSRCNCVEGFQHNGFDTFFDALRGLCNVKDCSGTNTTQCFGLPCNAGRCFC